jgi:hypothetical protein
LTKKSKARKYTLIGAGHEGNTVPDLQARVERDVIAKKPNLIFIYIDLRSVFVSYLSKHNPENSEEGILTHDGVHLNDEGNRLIAKQIMKYFEVTSRRYTACNI